MTPLLFIEGWARVAAGSLLTAIWQGFGLAAVAVLVLRTVPRLTATVRFAVWFGVFAVVAALPVVSGLHSLAAAAPAHGPAFTLGEGWSLTIAAVWIAASLVRAATLIAAAVQLRTLWTRARPVELSGASVVLSAMTRYRHAQLCVSDEVDRPSVIGFFAPRILMPAWLLEKLTPGEVEQVVLHEAGHLSRADDWLNLLQKLALVLFPLNPALLWLERRLCFEREVACDERVLSETGAPRAYAACLTRLAEYRMGRRAGSLSLALGMAGAFGRESELARRVGKILTRTERLRPWQSRLVLGGSLAALLVSTGELARCPQLVAFSAGQVTAQRSVSTRPISRPPAAIQNVVFRPAMRVLPPSAEPSRSAARTIRNDAAQGVAGPGWRMQASYAGTSGSRWVVVTTGWDEAGNWGTLVQALQIPARNYTRPARRVEAEELSPRPQEIYPYAAVPVRDGWLVLQM